MGVLMRKATQRQFVQKLLDTMFSTVKHSNQVEREVCIYQFMYTYCIHLCVYFGPLGAEEVEYWMIERTGRLGKLVDQVV